ncbi:MAG: T9SS type A sorting domain-containing protein [Nanoarchaeota archaeon]
MKINKLFLSSIIALNFLIPSKLKSQTYDSLKTVEVARILENKGFILNGYMINKPLEVQIDFNNKSITIDCPLIAEKQDNDSLMDYSLLVAFNKLDSLNNYNKNFIDNYGGLGFILDNNNVSPQVYADSIKKLLKRRATSVINISERPLEYILDEVYPNPSNGSINIKYKTKNSGILRFGIYDMLGRELSSFEENLNPGEYTKNINTNNLPSGSYFLRMFSNRNEFIETKRFVIVK